MNPNPLSDREKALEDQWVKHKEKQMAKDAAEKKQATAKQTAQGQHQEGQK